MRELSRGEVEEIAGRLASFFAGGATVMQASGLYKPPAGSLIKEPSAVVAVVSSGRESCTRFTRRMNAAAARASAMADQSSVLALTVCNGGKVNAKFATRTGAQDFPLPAVRER